MRLSPVSVYIPRKTLTSSTPATFRYFFGCFDYYWIGDRGKRVIKRLVERYADHGQVAYISSERVDAKLVHPEAIKGLKIKTPPNE